MAGTKSKTSTGKKSTKPENKMKKEEEPVAEVPAKKVSSKKKDTPPKKAPLSKKEAEPAQEASAKKTKEKKAKKVKTARAPTAYNIFMKDKISSITGSDQKEKLKTVAGMWKTLSSKEQEPYNKQAAEAKAQFEKEQAENPEYNAKKTAKRSPNAYNLFIKDRMATATGENQTSKLRAIAAEWKKLDESKKRPFVKEANKQKEEAKKLQEEAHA